MRVGVAFFTLTGVFVSYPAHALSPRIEVQAIGSFQIIHMITTVDQVIYQGPPIGSLIHSVELSWHSKDNNLGFKLTDNGDVLKTSTFVETRANTRCISGGLAMWSNYTWQSSNGYRLASEFSSLSDAPACNLGVKSYNNEIELADSEFFRALSAFKGKVLQVFGQISVRCLKIQRGYHGDICTQYSKDLPNAQTH